MRSPSSQGNAAASGAITLTGLWRRRWPRYGLIAAICLLLLLLLLPAVARIALQQWLLDNGADSAVIQNVDFNPFTWTASIEGADVRIQDRTVLADADFTLDLGGWPLFSRLLHVQSATLRGVHLEIEQRRDGGWRIGSVTFAGKPRAEPVGAEDRRLKIDQLRLADSRVRLIGPDLNLDVQVDAAALDNLFTGPAETPAHFRFQGKVNRAPVTVVARLSQLAPTLSIDGDVTVGEARLADYAGVLKNQLARLAGTLDMTGRMSVALREDGQWDAGYDGVLSVAALQLEIPRQGIAVNQGSAGISGKTSLQSGKALLIGHEGELLLKDGKVQTKAAGLENGQLSWKGAIRYASGRDPGHSVSLEGTLHGRTVGLDLYEKNLRADQESLELNAGLKLGLGNEAVRVQGNAAFKGAGIRVGERGRSPPLLAVAQAELQSASADGIGNLRAAKLDVVGITGVEPKDRGLEFALDRLGAGDLRLTDLKTVTLGALEAQGVKASDPRKEITLATLSGITASGLSADPSAGIGLDVLQLAGVELLHPPAKKATRPAVALEQAEASKVRWSSGRGAAAESVYLAGLRAGLRRGADGSVNLAQAPGEPDPQTGRRSGTDTKREKSDTTRDAEQPLPPLRIGKLAIGGKSHLDFEDARVSPAFRTRLDIKSARLENLDSTRPGSSAKYELEGQFGKQSKLHSSGSVRFFGADLGVTAKSSLRSFPLVQLSPYLANATGYVAQSGQLDLDSAVTIESGRIDSQNTVKLRKFYVEKADEETAAQAARESGMPLDAALSMLRDGNDNIKVDVPISGSLDEIEIGTGAILNKVLGKALAAGTKTYLLLAFQPWGSLIVVGEQVGKMASRIRLDPVVFAPGGAELAEEHKPYLAKLAQVMRDKPGIEVQLCAQVVGQDRRAPGGGPDSKPEPLTEEIKQQLFALGDRRAAAIREYLIAAHGVEAGRLHGCETGLDAQPEAQPRVDLGI